MENQSKKFLNILSYNKTTLIIVWISLSLVNMTFLDQLKMHNDTGDLISDFLENILGKSLSELIVPVIEVLLIIYLVKYYRIYSKNKEEVYKANNPGLIYKTKNNTNIVWLLPFFFMVIDLIVAGGEKETLKYLLLPSLIGGGIGALILWANNKDMSIEIFQNKLVITKKRDEVREYIKDQITSYRISKDQGKTVLRISANDKSEYEIASYFLELKGFEEALKKFLQ